MRPRRAWIYVLSVIALLVPAGGIAYLGAVSYRDERGAIAAQDEHQRRVAQGLVENIHQAIVDALDAGGRALTAGGGAARPAAPLARHAFWLDAEGRMRSPRPAPAALEPGGALDRGAPCAAGGRLEDCVRQLSTRQSRLARLNAAQRAEACRGDGCGASWAEARRQYTQLAEFDDTGPVALLGLARVLRRLEDPRGPQALAELERRFPDRTFEGVPVPLVVAVLRADGADALLETAEGVLASRYPLDPLLRLGVLAGIRSRLGEGLSPAQRQRRAALDAEVAAIRSEARAAAGLAADVPEILRTATAAWRGRAAARVPGRTLIYRRLADGGVVGLSVDAPMLERAAGAAPPDVAAGAGALVLAAGASPPPGLRRIVQVPLGEALPHLSLAIVNPLAEPDPRDEVVRERSRRHVAYTSALAVALALGLLLTIRGAARARELAQLKSDFVSTVSHELKTPLTSIRMFAEMLEQGVAQGDAARMARYHGVIVQESQRLGLLIANLLDYAQIEKGTRRYTASRQPLAQLARHAVTTFETLRDPLQPRHPSAAPGEGGRNAIEVSVSPEAMRAEVEVDRDVVIQAVLNLLANAAKYGTTERAIEVAVGADAVAGWIAVRDHGPGIPPSEQPRIFREFYRAPEAYRSGVEGTGLGLALVKRHVEALGGTVEVASEVGQGATFTIRLPRVQRAA